MRNYGRGIAPGLALLLFAAAVWADSGSADPLLADLLADGRKPAYGPPGEAPGIPTPEELETAGARIGKVLIDNQNIFDLADPRDDTGLFRLANHLHARTRARVIRGQLLFAPGERYSRRLVEETERILRDNSYFYDAWIRAVAWHDGIVDLRVTTRDVWTLNPGFNFGRSGGSNSTGVKLEEGNLLGTGVDVQLTRESNIDRRETRLRVSDMHLPGTWIQASATYAQASDGRLRDLLVQRPFYALDSRWAAGFAANDDLQTDSLYDRSRIIDQFSDLHHYLRAYGGWSAGLREGWVRRFSSGVTYDEHRFAPVGQWTGVTVLPQDRRFLYPWVEMDVLQDSYLRLWNHDQIARTEDFYTGTAASLRLGWADSAFGSSRSALMFSSSAARGFNSGGRATLLLNADFSGRVENGSLRNAVADAAVRYYVEQSKNWLFFTTLQGTRGWNLDLDNQILLGGDNGLRGYPLRYQDGTTRALWTVEQRYFTDWYPFRLFRVGAAIFFDAGRTWGSAPLATQSLGILTDAGFGLRFGNARSGLGNVVHVDLAFPFNGDGNIKRVQFLVQTEQRF
ncbi:MAG: hypothetical protein JSR67_10690 [Proteobacteria bacterium]|nr:hypothetical protein [Pseudomonadota bacterium]